METIDGPETGTSFTRVSFGMKLITLVKRLRLTVRKKIQNKKNLTFKRCPDSSPQLILHESCVRILISMW